MEEIEEAEEAQAIDFAGGFGQQQQIRICLDAGHDPEQLKEIFNQAGSDWPCGGHEREAKILGKTGEKRQKPGKTKDG